MALLALVGCHGDKTPHTTVADVEAAQVSAQQGVEEARAEATKDVKSAIKTGGANSRDVALAKATAAYDVAMVKAEGDHKVASEKCDLLQAAQMQSCKDQADSEYAAAKSAAKAARLAR